MTILWSREKQCGVLKRLQLCALLGFMSCQTNLWPFVVTMEPSTQSETNRNRGTWDIIVIRVGVSIIRSQVKNQQCVKVLKVISCTEKKALLYIKTGTVDPDCAEKKAPSSETMQKPPKRSRFVLFGENIISLFFETRRDLINRHLARLCRCPLGCQMCR